MSFFKSLVSFVRMFKQWISFVGSFLIFFVSLSGVSAQETKLESHHRVLQSLYAQQLRNPDDVYIQQRIDAEREKIRSSIEEDLQESIIKPTEEEGDLETAEITKALDRQNNVITTLKERIGEREADLSLLKTEESQYYLAERSSTGATQGEFRLTESHAELLAMRTTLTERVDVLESMLVLQENRLQQLIVNQRLQQFQLFITIGKYLLVLLVVWLVEKLIRTVLLIRIKNRNTRYTVTKVFSSAVYLIAFVWIIGVVFSRQPSLLASLAIVGAGLAIGLQDVVKDILGWFVIHQNGLFSKGQRITVGPITGEVIDIGLLRTTLLEIGTPGETTSSVLERTGKTLYVPNSLVLNQKLTNHNTTSDFVRGEMRFAITFESDWRRAKEILEQIVEEVAGDFAERENRQSHRTRLYYIPHNTRGNQVYMDIATDGVEYTLRFVFPIGERRPVVSRITDLVMERFNAEPQIDLAYSTRRIIRDPEK